jgi:hypothetical protein
MKRLILILLLAISFLLRSTRVTADGYNILELRNEQSTALPPFSVVSGAPHPGGLRLFLSTANPDVVASLLPLEHLRPSSPVTTQRLPPRLADLFCSFVKLPLESFDRRLLEPCFQDAPAGGGFERDGY